MKKYSLLFLIAISIVFSSCSSGKESTGVWVNKEKSAGKTFNSLFIVVMTANVEARRILETDLADVAKAKGYKSVKSIDVMSPSLSGPEMPSKEDIVNKVKESGCNAVFIASLLKKEEDLRYIPGTTAYSVRPYYSWSGNYYGYYSHWYPSVSTLAYYTTEKNYFMQSNLYDVVSEEIMWSVQSEVFNPSSLKRFSKIYTSGLVKQLEKEGLLSK